MGTITQPEREAIDGTTLRARQRPTRGTKVLAWDVEGWDAVGYWRNYGKIDLGHIKREIGGYVAYSPHSNVERFHALRRQAVAWLVEQYEAAATS